MSFQQGISGLNAASRNLEVIGNNIANASTVGAKLARAEFAGVYANAAGAQAAGDTGMGVEIAGVMQQFTQGPVRTTENPLDVAINGTGFFQVTRADGSDAAYTRNGQFHLDNTGYVVNSQGMRLQGFPIDAATGRAGGVAGSINLPTQGIAPQVTRNAGVALNLDGRTAAPTGATPAFSLSDPSSYTASTALSVYDQQGNEQVVSLYFRRTAVDNQWDVYAALNGNAVPPVAAGVQPPAGRLAFGPDGTFDAAASGTLAGGVLAPGALTLDLPFSVATLPVTGGTATTAPVDLTFAGSTQFGRSFGVTAVSQDGFTAGQLTGYGVNADGLLEARYSNGKTLGAARIALADFRNSQGLAPAGGNLWRATPASGQPALGGPGSANLGLLQGGALEDSNIDITAQLVEMITAQRAYQANAQTIKTQDQMMSTLVNLR